MKNLSKESDIIQKIDDNSVDSEIIAVKASYTLDTRRRILKYEIPLVTEREITKTDA
jgi:hypothetical protein